MGFKNDAATDGQGTNSMATHEKWATTSSTTHNKQRCGLALWLADTTSPKEKTLEHPDAIAPLH